MEKALITAKGTLTIPFALREKYGFLDSGMAVLVEQSDGLLVKKLTPDFFNNFLGKYADDVPSPAELRHWAIEEIAADEARTKSYR